MLWAVCNLNGCFGLQRFGAYMYGLCFHHLVFPLLADVSLYDLCSLEKKQIGM